MRALVAEGVCIGGASEATLALCAPAMLGGSLRSCAASEAALRGGGPGMRRMTSAGEGTDGGGGGGGAAKRPEPKSWASAGRTVLGTSASGICSGTAEEVARLSGATSLDPRSRARLSGATSRGCRTRPKNREGFRPRIDATLLIAVPWLADSGAGSRRCGCTPRRGRRNRRRRRLRAAPGRGRCGSLGNRRGGAPCLCCWWCCRRWRRRRRLHPRSCHGRASSGGRTRRRRRARPDTLLCTRS